MKKIALISTYCDTDTKIIVLKENIMMMKSLGVDVMVISPIKLPEEIIEISDFVFFTKENHLLVWPLRDFTFWKSVYTKEGFVKMHRNIADYGWAALNQVKRLSQIALNYDYDIFYHMIYDLEIDSEVIKEIKTNQCNLIHPRVNPKNLNELWEATLHFMIFDKKVLEKITQEINFTDYLSQNGVAEGFALNWAKKIPLKISSHPVKDKIYYWENYDFFNYSKNSDYKLFINKHQDCETWIGSPPTMQMLDSKLRLFFYDVQNTRRINVFCDGLSYDFLLDSNKFIQLGRDCFDVKELVIDGINYTEEYEKIMRNISYIDND